MSNTLPTIADKRQWIKERLEITFSTPKKSEMLALDFEMNLLMCAVQSYKHETILKPFPSTFLSDSNNSKNYTQLLNTVESMPPVTEWLNKINRFNLDQLALVYWFLIHRNYELKHCTSMNQEKLKELTKYSANFSEPTHIFEIKYSEEKNKKFELLKEQLAQRLTDGSLLTSTSFHGTRMDNVHSILHLGLLSHLSKNALFGEGTYLSQEPSISLHYSPANKTWQKSLIGQRMSCLLVTETINDPNHVKTGINEKSNEKSKSSSNVPEKYFIVSNNDYVRVKYVLVYAEKAKPRRKNKLLQLINENKFVLLLVGYSLLLVFIGLMNSRAFHKYFKLSYMKLSNLILGEAAIYE